MAHPNVALVVKSYDALNRRDLDGFISAFADDAVLHGADGQIERKDAILSVIRQLIGLSENSLEIDVHDILANDTHTVVLQTTKAQLGERQLEDRVVYVFHMNDDGLIRDAYFTGDPRVQEEFYGLTWTATVLSGQRTFQEASDNGTYERRFQMDGSGEWLSL